MTVTVTLKSNGSGTVDPANPANNTERIAANGFIYGIDEGNLSAAAAKYRSQVTAADKDGEPIPAGDIQTDTTQLAAINAAIAAGKSGEFPLTYSTPGGTSVIITVILKDRATEPNQDPHDADKVLSGNIGANDFIYGINESGSLSADDAKLRGRVSAKDMFGNDYDLMDITVDAAELAAVNAAKQAGQTGKFPLTYTSPEGKSVTIQVTILNEVEPPVVDPNNPANNESSIGANDFNYGANEGSLTADKAKELANVIAKDKDGVNIPSAQISVDQTQLDAINKALENGDKGTYPLTFTEPGGKSVTIDVAIWDKVIHNPDPDNQQEMGGNNFDYDIQDGSLSKDKAKELANIYAKDKLGKDIPLDEIDVNQSDLDKINQAIKNGKSGEFELRFTTSDGQELSITVTLYDGKVVDVDDSNNKKISKKKAKFVRTGDTSDILLWLALAAAAIAAVIAIVYRRKRRKV